MKGYKLLTLHSDLQSPDDFHILSGPRLSTDSGLSPGQSLTAGQLLCSAGLSQLTKPALSPAPGPQQKYKASGASEQYLGFLFFGNLSFRLS